MRTLMIALLLLSAGIAEGRTAFYDGERAGRMRKTCMYSDAYGITYSTFERLYDSCPMTINVDFDDADCEKKRPPIVGTVPPSIVNPIVKQPPVAFTTTAFLTGETETGDTKQCYYDAIGVTYVQTYDWFDLCPFSIQVQQ
jgi:hypothetical protein